jgi:hypothetical protein
MADFMARHAKGAREDYKKLDDTQANEFLIGLASAQQVYMLLGVSCIVDMGVYKQIDDVFQLQTMVPAFALGARVCVSLIETWQKQHSIEYPVECVFEDGDFGRGKFIDLMRVERMPAPIFKEKNDFPGLQAADYLAWEVANYMKRESVDPHQQARDSFSRLLAIPRLHIQATLASLLELCEKKGIPIKRGKIIIPRS